MVRMPTVPPFRSSTLANFFCVMMKWLSLPEFAAIMRNGPPRSTFWMMPSTDDSTRLSSPFISPAAWPSPLRMKRMLALKPSSAK